MHYYICDTNVFLHCKPLDQTDPKDFSETDSVWIVVPFTVISELDKRKANPTDGILRKRAKNAIAMLEKAESSNMLANGIHVVHSALKSGFDFIGKHLGESWPDDRIIAEALQFAADHKDDEVIVLAYDYGLRLKAKRFGLDAIEPPETIALPEVDDPRDKEISVLKREIDRLSSSTPILTLKAVGKGGKGTHQVFEITGQPSEIKAKQNATLAKICQGAPSYRQGFDGVAFYPYYDEASFKQEWDTYVAAYETYVQEWLRFKNRTFEMRIDLLVSNDIPAEDVEVRLSVSKYRDVGLIAVAPVQPKEPAAPAPKRILDLSMASRLQYGPATSRDERVATQVKDDIISFHVSLVRPGIAVELNAFALRFSDNTRHSNFSIDYAITAKNAKGRHDASIGVIFREISS